MRSKQNRLLKSALSPLGCVLLLAASAAFAQAPAPANPVPAKAPDASKPAPAAKPEVHSPFQPSRFPKKARAFYENAWGIDSLSVRAVESGELIRFSYRVLDPVRAKVLNDKNTEAFLIYPERNIKLIIPALEKVGQLRQSNTPLAGTSYWMAFSNPHKDVKQGAHVNIVIGNFHAENLQVD